MAIEKKAVVTKVSQEVEDTVLFAEGIIDKKLENYSGGEIIVDYKDLKIPHPIDDNFVNRFQKEIIKRYRSAGWKVTVDSDQRAGSWFKFS